MLDEEEKDISPKAIILAEMKAEGVKVEDIPFERYFTSPDDAISSKRYFERKGFAWFACPEGDKKWPSAHAWCVIDLRTQCICFHDTQECNQCESEARPEFSAAVLRKMAKSAVKTFLRRTGRLAYEPPADTDNEGQQGGGPHDQNRCGKCQRLGYSCWN